MRRTTKSLIGITAGVVILAGVAFLTQSSLEHALLPRRPLSPLNAVDQILETLELGRIAFNTPATIPLGDTAIIELILSTTESIETLQGMLNAVGERTGACILVSNEMEARLTGRGFGIEAITREVQAVSGEEVTKWKWEIEPTEGGVQRLHLTLSALLYMEGSRTPRTIRTFERTIEVRVSWRRKVSDFVTNNWQWLLTALVIPLGVWIVQKMRERDESNEKPNNA